MSLCWCEVLIYFLQPASRTVFLQLRRLFQTGNTKTRQHSNRDAWSESLQVARLRPSGLRIFSMPRQKLPPRVCITVPRLTDLALRTCGLARDQTIRGMESLTTTATHGAASVRILPSVWHAFGATNSTMFGSSSLRGRDHLCRRLASRAFSSSLGGVTPSTSSSSSKSK